MAVCAPQPGMPKESLGPHLERLSTRHRLLVRSQHGALALRHPSSAGRGGDVIWCVAFGCRIPEERTGIDSISLAQSDFWTSNQVKT